MLTSGRFERVLFSFEKRIKEVQETANAQLLIEDQEHVLASQFKKAGDEA